MTGTDPLSLEGIDRIPDPAAGVARAPAPPATPPAEPSPTRAVRRTWMRAVAAGAVAWVAAALMMSGVRHDIGSPVVMMPLVAWAATIAVGLAVLLRPRERGLPVGIRVVQHALWAVPAIYVVAVLVVGAGAGDPPFGWASVRRCLGMANLMALGPLMGLALVLRGAFLTGAGWRGAAVGALAGLAGSLGVHAHCPAAALDHLLAAHGPSIVIGAGLGAIFGRMRGRT